MNAGVSISIPDHLSAHWWRWIIGAARASERRRRARAMGSARAGRSNQAHRTIDQGTSTVAAGTGSGGVRAAGVAWWDAVRADVSRRRTAATHQAEAEAQAEGEGEGTGRTRTRSGGAPHRWLPRVLPGTHAVGGRRLQERTAATTQATTRAAAGTARRSELPRVGGDRRPEGPRLQHAARRCAAGGAGAAGRADTNCPGGVRYAGDVR